MSSLRTDLMKMKRNDARKVQNIVCGERRVFPEFAQRRKHKILNLVN